MVVVRSVAWRYENHNSRSFSIRIMKLPKLNLLTMSVTVRLMLVLIALAVLWLAIAWALGWLSHLLGGAL